MNRYQSIVILDLAINTGKDRRRERNKQKALEDYASSISRLNKKQTQRWKDAYIRELNSYLPK